MYRPPFPRRLALNIEINVSQNTSADNQGQPEVNPEFEEMSVWLGCVSATYADGMVDFGGTISKAEATKVLKRVGVPDEKIADIMGELDDPIDVERDTAILEKYGISRDVLVDRMGGSP